MTNLGGVKAPPMLAAHAFVRFYDPDFSQLLVVVQVGHHRDRAELMLASFLKQRSVTNGIPLPEVPPPPSDEW
jgi:hypothetical protein